VTLEKYHSILLNKQAARSTESAMSPASTFASTEAVSDSVGQTSEVNVPSAAFKYGGVPTPPGQVKLLAQVRMPTYENFEDERAFRKLHHAAALRWLGAHGYNNEGAGGHVTVRDPILTDHFWINPHAKSFSHIKPEDLCLVNDQGVVVDGNMHAINPAGFSIHSAVHRARPDIIAAVHCHSIPSKAFAAFGKPLDMISQDACRSVSTDSFFSIFPPLMCIRFYRAHSVYQGFGGSALDPQEGKNIAEALGDGKAVILQNHGILAVSKTVDGAAFNFGALDRCIEAQLLADAAGKNRGWETIKVPHEEAEYTRKVYWDELEYITFQPAFEDVVRASGGELTMTI
jgi:ribulose-5-phosphate 4-epimerase/fuculose-1-phosphate aldolase